ncbi:hypothetical protein [Mesorhizobium sp. M7A.F.Ca.MR.245.00.0.0]|uniref:hypothetical protein n=1 Tax=Mesorhizobium sp. M7A.F.Ca.MR.245.00.0.0 TaxID=2496778 RepID=UPI0019D1F127|nr:hypothetical protein [Mesorhizobium sp. M7A.F.Ca.MR.245.00.0.0]
MRAVAAAVSASCYRAADIGDDSPALAAAAGCAADRHDAGCAAAIAAAATDRFDQHANSTPAIGGDVAGVGTGCIGAIIARAAGATAAEQAEGVAAATTAAADRLYGHAAGEITMRYDAARIAARGISAQSGAAAIAAAADDPDAIGAIATHTTCRPHQHAIRGQSRCFHLAGVACRCGAAGSAITAVTSIDAETDDVVTALAAIAAAGIGENAVGEVARRRDVAGARRNRVGVAAGIAASGVAAEVRDRRKGAAATAAIATDRRSFEAMMSRADGRNHSVVENVDGSTHAAIAALTTIGFNGRSSQAFAAVAAIAAIGSADKSRCVDVYLRSVVYGSRGRICNRSAGIAIIAICVKATRSPVRSIRAVLVYDELSMRRRYRRKTHQRGGAEEDHQPSGNHTWPATATRARRFLRTCHRTKFEQSPRLRRTKRTRRTAGQRLAGKPCLLGYLCHMGIGSVDTGTRNRECAFDGKATTL